MKLRGLNRGLCADTSSIGVEVTWGPILLSLLRRTR